MEGIWRRKSMFRKRGTDEARGGEEEKEEQRVKK
jgi:hypothetical protein